MNPESTHILQIEEFGEGTVLYRLGVALGAEDLNVLGLKMGVPPKTVATWKHRGSVPYEQVEKVARAKGLSLDYLMLGRQQLQVEDAGADYVFSQQLDKGDSIPDGFILVPRYEVQASAGGGTLIHSEMIVNYLAFEQAWIAKMGLNRDKLALVEVHGDSMVPELNNQDLILVDMRMSALSANGIYVIQWNGHLLVKRIQTRMDGSVTVISDNPKYAPEQLTAEQAQSLIVLGLVVWSGRRM